MGPMASPHRSVLDGKEEDLRAALQELESARGEERALQGRLEQERLQRLRAEAQHAQALGVSATGPAGAGSHSSGSSRLGDLCSDSVVAAMLVSPHHLQPFDCAGQTHEAQPQRPVSGRIGGRIQLLCMMWVV